MTYMIISKTSRSLCSLSSLSNGSLTAWEYTNRKKIQTMIRKIFWYLIKSRKG